MHAGLPAHECYKINVRSISIQLRGVHEYRLPLVDQTKTVIRKPALTCGTRRSVNTRTAKDDYQFYYQRFSFGGQQLHHSPACLPKLLGVTIRFCHLVCNLT